MGDDLVERIKNHANASGQMADAQTASVEAIAAAESALGFALPRLLTSCYREICNGGFGPGYGIIGVAGGHESDYGDIVSTYQLFASGTGRAGNMWEAGLLPFCGWGCAIVSCVRCDATLQICTCEEGQIWPQRYTLNDFFEMWLKGTDILAQDPDVGMVDITFPNPFTGRNQTTSVRRRNRK